MSKNVTATVKELEFHLEKKGGKLVVHLNDSVMNLERLFPELVKKYTNSSDEDFANLGVGGHFSVVMNCTIEEDTDYLIPEIDGKSGKRTTIEGVHNEDLLSVSMIIFEEDTEILKRDISVSELAKEEVKVITEIISDKVLNNERDVEVY